MPRLQGFAFVLQAPKIGSAWRRSFRRAAFCLLIEADLVGALAVLVTLVYLSMQIRQHTKSLQAAAVDSANIQVSRCREVIFADADVANMFRRGNQDPASLSEDDAIRYRLLMHNIMLALSNSITQASVSGLSKSRSEFELTVLGRVLATVGGRRLAAASHD